MLATLKKILFIDLFNLVIFILLLYRLFSTTFCEYYFIQQIINCIFFFHIIVLTLNTTHPKSCGADSQSDSVRLSNVEWPSTDIRLPPICNTASEAQRKSRKFTSEGSFFMVTFQSNNNFDATGFDASYSFIPSHGLL